MHIPTKVIVHCRTSSRPNIHMDCVLVHGTSCSPPIPSLSNESNIEMCVHGAVNYAAFFSLWVSTSVWLAPHERGARRLQQCFYLTYGWPSARVSCWSTHRIRGAAVVEIGQTSKDRKRHNITNPIWMFALPLQKNRVPHEHPLPSHFEHVLNGGWVCSGSTRPQAYSAKHQTRGYFGDTKLRADIIQSRSIVDFS